MKSPFQPSPGRAVRAAVGFTLIELLVTIGVVTLLATLLFPAVGKLKTNASKAQCASQLRQIMTATTLYAGENNGLLPVLGWTGGNSPHRIQRDHFEEKFQSYLGERNVMMFCPGPLKKVRNANTSQAYKDNFVTYQYALMPLWNQANAPKRLAGTAAGTPLWSCLSYRSGALSYGHNNPGTAMPMEGMNVACLDGSVRWVDAKDLTTWGQDGAAEFLWPKP